MPGHAKKDDTWKTVGVWLWGGITVALAIGILAVIITSIPYLNHEGKFVPTAPASVYQPYFALKDQGGLIGGIVGFSGLAWTIFFQIRHSRDTT